MYKSLIFSLTLSNLVDFYTDILLQTVVSFWLLLKRTFLILNTKHTSVDTRVDCQKVPTEWRLRMTYSVTVSLPRNPERRKYKLKANSSSLIELQKVVFRSGFQCLPSLKVIPKVFRLETLGTSLQPDRDVSKEPRRQEIWVPFFYD